MAAPKLTGSSRSRAVLLEKVRSLRAGLRHAFALRAMEPPLSPEDVALLDRLAEAVVARGMATPAVLFLDSLGPMNFLGSQALHFLAPILDVVFPQREIERIARLLERRDTLARLVALIEARVETRRTGGP